LQETLDASEQLLEEALRVGWRTGMLRINADQPYDAEAPWTRQALRRLNDQMRQVPQNTRRIINEVIAAGQSDPSKSVEDIADDIVQRMRRMASGSGGPEQSGSAVQSRARRVAATSRTGRGETLVSRGLRGSPSAMAESQRATLKLTASGGRWGSPTKCGGPWTSRRKK